MKSYISNPFTCLFYCKYPEKVVLICDRTIGIFPLLEASLQIFIGCSVKGAI
jgi:hypothetical protein